MCSQVLCDSSGTIQRLDFLVSFSSNTKGDCVHIDTDISFRISQTAAGLELFPFLMPLGKLRINLSLKERGPFSFFLNTDFKKKRKEKVVLISRNP